MSNKSADYELNYLKACLEQLEPYLLSNDVYRTLTIRAPIRNKPYPQFTLGWMLLFQKWAQACATTPDQISQFNLISQNIERFRTKWRSAWGAKASKEFSARLSLWRDFLIDFRKNPEGNVDRFEYEISRRVLLELLEQEADNLTSAETEALVGLDILLKALISESEFIWDNKLSSYFPKTRFWFLYGRLEIKNSY